MGWGKQRGVKPPRSKALRALSSSVVSRRLMAIWAVKRVDEVCCCPNLGDSAALRYPLPDAALASEVQNRGCERTGGVYTAVAQDAKLEILGSGSI